MDDVLASIRRIVRAEKEPAAEPDSATAKGPATGPDAAPTLGPPFGPAGDRDRPGEARAAEAEPLELTPDMRLADEVDDDDDDGDEVEPEAIARPAVMARHSPPPAAVPSPSREAPTPDRETLRRMVREILLDELADGDAEGAVRSIIRDELMNGQIGGNISQNVQRLIQSEIAKALEER